MKQITAVVEHGQIKLPETVSLPEGSVVQVVWDDENTTAPLETEAWTEEESKAELAWATGRRFPA